MKRNLTLTICNMFSVLLMTFHMTSDTLRAKAGNPEAGGSTLVVVPFLALWVWATLVLGERRSGVIIMLVMSLLGLVMPVVHVMGPSGWFSGQLAKGNGGDFLFVWTLQAIGVNCLFSVFLAVRELWSRRAD